MLETARRIGAEYGLDYWRALDQQGAYPSAMWQAICDAGFGGHRAAGGTRRRRARDARPGAGDRGALRGRGGLDARPDLHGEPDFWGRRHRALWHGGDAPRPAAAAHRRRHPKLHGAHRTRRRHQQPGAPNLRRGPRQRLAPQRAQDLDLGGTDGGQDAGRGPHQEGRGVRAPHRRHLALPHRRGTGGADPFHHREGRHPLRAGEQRLFRQTRWWPATSWWARSTAAGRSCSTCSTPSVSSPPPAWSARCGSR